MMAVWRSPGETRSNGQSDDNRLLAAQRGDPEALGAIVVELLPRVRSIVRYLLGDDVDADDIEQVVVLETLRGFASYRGEGPFDRWVGRIARRAALAHRRQKALERLRRLDVAPDAVPASGPPEAERVLLRRRAIDLLVSLPIEQRRAVALHYLEGMTVPELARELDIPFETARSRLRLAMRRLRRRGRAGRFEA